jgi:hypothetical protein
MSDNSRELVERIHREAAANYGDQPLRPSEPETIHYSELAEATPGSPLCKEWNFYRREVARLLAEGNEGKHVLIKGEEIIGIWDTFEEAMGAGYERFLGQPFLVQQIQERERVLRCLSFWRCRI